MNMAAESDEMFNELVTICKIYPGGCVMKFSEVVLARRSIRAFLPDPVPRETIMKIADVARWAPSWGNTQPWEIVVADGDKCKILADRFADEGRKGMAPRPDIEMPKEFQGESKKRYMELGGTLLGFMGINREDKDARMRHYINMYRFFEAPCVVYFIIDGRLNAPYSCLDVGSIATLFCCAAAEEGLGTIYLAASMHFPDIIKEVLGIPEEKKIVIGVALGYPHPDAPAAKFRSEREGVGTIMRFA